MIGLTDTGPADGRTVVFLHGGVINRHMWGPVTDFLDQDFRCLSVDIPGHGERMDLPYTTESSAELVETVLDETGGDSAVLVGLSLGGYVAQAAAAAAPGKVGGLVLSGATVRYTGWDGTSTKLYGYAFPVLARPALRAFEKKMTEDLGPELAERIIAGKLSAKGGAQALRRLPGKDWAAELNGLGIPTLIANGERDTGNREAESLFLEHVPDADVVTIHDAGHACALQQPEAFAKAVRRLAESIP